MPFKKVSDPYISTYFQELMNTITLHNKTLFVLVPEIVVVVGVGKDDVEWLQVQVDDALAVDKLHPTDNLPILRELF